MIGKYADIASMPHKEPRNRVRMALQSRAAQFAPFAALTGLDGEMTEQARLTEQKKELCEYEQEELNDRLRILSERLRSGEKAHVAVTYFVCDKKKKGGSYVRAVGVLRRIDEVRRELIFTDIPPVKIEDILTIQ